MSSRIGEVLSIERYFYMQRLAFSVIGIDVDGSAHSKVWRRPWLTALTCGCLLSLLGSMAHFSVLHIDDMDKVTAALTPFLQGLLSVWKVCIFIINRNDMATLIKRVWAMTMSANAEELKIISEENRRETLLSRYYAIAVFVTAGAVCIPSLMYIYTFFSEPSSLVANIEKFTPFQTSYFLDPTSVSNYIVLYIWCICSIVFLVYGSLAVDTLFCWLVYNMAARFRMLCRRLQLIGSEAHDAPDAAIRVCIKAHQKVIADCTELKRLFNWIIFVEFTLNCLQVCFLAYQLGRGMALENVPFLALFQIAVALQLMIYCYGGQRIKDESESVALEIWSSFQWHETSIRSKKLLLPPMLRAQSCCYLNGFFFVLDLHMYLLVFKHAASYVSLLWSLNE